MVKKRKFFVITILVVLVGFGGFLTFRSKAAKLGELTDPLTKGTIVESVYGIGTVTPENKFQLKLGSSSVVSELFVAEGDAVAKDAPLVNINGVVFRAPFDGAVTSLPYKIGENIFAQTIVLELVDFKQRYIQVSLEQRGALRVKSGQTAKLSFDSLRDKNFSGVVRSVYSRDNEFLVRIDVNGLPSEILPDMTGDVAIAIKEHKDTLLIPVAALTEGKVTVDRDLGGVKQVEVKIGVIDGDKAQVVSGDLHEGDRLYIRKKIAP